jgi:hypothetical protein
MNFAQTAKTSAQINQTENGAMAYNTTTNALLDLFAQIGALRPRSEGEIEMKYADAYAVNPELAIKMLFYAGNIRGGLGERRTFRICLRWLAKNYPAVVRDNLVNIPHFNRWDSLFTLVGTPVESDMWQYIVDQLKLDMTAVVNEKKGGKHAGISLLAKWMPTETAHAKEARALAKKATRALGVTPRQYRKMLSALRAHLRVVESLMSANKWDEVEYPAVPSYAMKNYRKAFSNHDNARFGEYIASLNKGEVKINASTLFPYDLVHQYMNRRYSGVGADAIIEAQWKALPNYVEGDNNILVMADVSGSMYGRPIETSIGLATYFAQHNTGDYHGLYMTFTDRPHFIDISRETTLAGCVNKVNHTDVGYSTNLDRAFEYVLNHAIDNHITNEDMPKALVVISDMEIDPYFRGRRNMDFVQKWVCEFAKFGYTLPLLCLWNVDARNDTFLSQNDNVLLVSGQSASTFHNLCSALGGKTAWEFMCDVLNDPMYDCVVI